MDRVLTGQTNTLSQEAILDVEEFKDKPGVHRKKVKKKVTIQQ